jgi:hypothetical protein
MYQPSLGRLCVASGDTVALASLDRLFEASVMLSSLLRTMVWKELHVPTKIGKHICP